MRRAVFALAVVVVMVTLTPTLVATAPPREAAVGTLAAQGKLFCHRSFRATGWVATGSRIGSGGQGYREADQDTTDMTLCGFDDDFGPYIDFWSTVPPTVGGAAPINGITNMTTTVAGDTVWTTNELDPCPRRAPCIGQGSGIVGWRWYMYNSNSATCECAKRVDAGDYWADVGCQFNTKGTNVPISWNGAAEVIPGLNSGMFRGKWWRIEGYMNWPLSSASFQQIYWKDLTSGQEYGLRVASMQNVRTFTDVVRWIHMYRDGRSVPGTCTNGYLYLLVAKNLAPGERIPPAVEVEGGASGGGSPTSPNSPSAVTIQ